MTAVTTTSPARADRTDVLTLLGLVAHLELAAFTRLAADAKQDAQLKTPEMKLPPGWTEEDMKACMAAATPGKMQALLGDRRVALVAQRRELFLGDRQLFVRAAPRFGLPQCWRASRRYWHCRCPCRARW